MYVLCVQQKWCGCCILSKVARFHILCDALIISPVQTHACKLSCCCCCLLHRQVCDEGQRERLLSRVRCYYETLKTSQFGKHIVNRLEKLLSAGMRIQVNSLNVAMNNNPPVAVPVAVPVPSAAAAAVDMPPALQQQQQQQQLAAAAAIAAAVEPADAAAQMQPQPQQS